MDYHTLDLNMGQKNKKSFHSQQKGNVKEADTAHYPHSTQFYNFLYN